MRGMTLKAIAEAVCGTLYIKKDITSEELEREASSVVIDSRQAEKNGIFVAVKGAKADGHSFIPQVLETGVLGVICQDRPQDENGSYIVVKDSLEAIKKLAKYYRSLFDIPVIGIIGSMGKTGTKEMTASVLAEKYRVLKTEGNFNNGAGVPLTLFRLRNEHEIAVIEMGISEFGEMSMLADIVRPDSVVMTNIGPCHLEQLGDLDGVFRAKTEVFDYLSTKGRVFLNGDDIRLRQVKEAGGKPPVFFAVSQREGIDVYADEIVNKQLQGLDALFHIKGPAEVYDRTENRGVERKAPDAEFEVHIPLPGEHSVNNALAGCAVGSFYGLSPEEIREGIGKAQGMKGRMNPVRTDKCLIIDDCYNANPNSMKNALTLLARTKAQGQKVRCVAILGDMFELGEQSEQLHREVGRFAVDNGTDLLLIAGENSRAMYEEAGDANALYYENTDSLIEALKNGDLIRKDDVVLVKASHSMGFERVVEVIRGMKTP